MSYTWITPKTNWTKNDYITPTDYNRIRNNLLYLNDMLNTRYPAYTQPLDLGSEKAWGSNNYPSEWNAFEDALESFTRIGQDENLGTRGNFVDNGNFVTADQLNRIELCIQRWYELPVETGDIPLPYIFGYNGMACVCTDGLHILGGVTTDPSNPNTTIKNIKHYVYDGTQFIEKADMPKGYAYGMTASLNSYVENTFAFTVSDGGRFTHFLFANNAYTNKGGVMTTGNVAPYTKSALCCTLGDLFILGGDSYQTDVNRYERSFATSTKETFSAKESVLGANAVPCTKNNIGSAYSYDTNMNKLMYLERYYELVPSGQGYMTNKEMFRWKKEATMPHKHKGARLVMHNGVLYLFGGENETGYYSYDDTEKTWTKVGDLPYPVAYGCVESFNGHIYVIGGQGEGNNGDKMLVIDVD